ncbi:hypothetical protein NQ318_000149, partial [Aromia moschata]
MHKITILQMIGYGDRPRTQAAYFKKNIRSCRRYLKVPETVLGTWTLRQLKKNPPNKLRYDQKLDVMLMLEENPHTSSRNYKSSLDEGTIHYIRYTILYTQNPENVNIWAGIIGENIIGPFFIDGNLTGETYLALLQNN